MEGLHCRKETRVYHENMLGPLSWVLTALGNAWTSSFTIRPADILTLTLHCNSNCNSSKSFTLNFKPSAHNIITLFLAQGLLSSLWKSRISTLSFLISHLCPLFFFPLPPLYPPPTHLYETANIIACSLYTLSLSRLPPHSILNTDCPVNIITTLVKPFHKHIPSFSLGPNHPKRLEAWLSRPQPKPTFPG